MKKLIPIIFLTLFGFIKTAQATTHSIYVTGIGINPVSSAAICGDTVVFHWNGGTDSTRSTTLPICATPWSSPIDATTPTYSILIGCPGTYNFSCYVLNGTTKTYTASITVTCSGTSIANNTNQILQTSIFPNPAQNNFTIQTNRADNQNLQVFDVSGKLVLAQTISGTTSIDVGTLPEGVYILHLTNNQSIVNKRITILK